MPRSVKKKSSNKHKKSDRYCHKVDPTPEETRKLKEQAQVAERLLSFREKHSFFTSATTQFGLENITRPNCIDIHKMTWAEFIKEQKTDLKNQKTGLKAPLNTKLISGQGEGEFPVMYSNRWRVQQPLACLFRGGRSGALGVVAGG